MLVPIPFNPRPDRSAIAYAQLHPGNVKPNHHYLTHIFEQLDDYGPVYGFWTFVFERLNKVLKSYATSGHGGGEIEVAFIREFMRNAALRHIVRIHGSGSLPRHITDEHYAQLRSVEEELCAGGPSELDIGAEQTVAAIRLMLASDSDSRGTVASLAHAMDVELADGMPQFLASRMM